MSHVLSITLTLTAHHIFRKGNKMPPEVRFQEISISLAHVRKSKLNFSKSMLSPLERTITEAQFM